MTRHVTLSRWLRAARERVFEAFTSPAAIQSWMGPENCTVPRASVDLRVGGRYRIEMHGANGDVYVVGGEYLVIEPPSKLSFTWQWQNKDFGGDNTQVSVLFTDKDNGTLLELRHEGFADDDSARQHDEGWISTVNCLERMLAGELKQPLAQPVVLGDPRSTYVRSARMVFVESMRETEPPLL
jgi:glutathione S-transferase